MAKEAHIVRQELSVEVVCRRATAPVAEDCWRDGKGFRGEVLWRAEESLAVAQQQIHHAAAFGAFYQIARQRVAQKEVAARAFTPKIKAWESF